MNIQSRAVLELILGFDVLKVEINLYRIVNLLNDVVREIMKRALFQDVCIQLEPELEQDFLSL